MGHVEITDVPNEKRTVPSTAADFVRARRQFAAQMKMLRKKYGEEWVARQDREAEAVSARRADTEAQKADLRARKAARSAARREAHIAQIEQARAAASARAEVSRKAHEFKLSQRSQQRRQWLSAVDDDATGWVRKGREEEDITPALFDMKYPSHLEAWYDAQQRLNVAAAAEAQGDLAAASSMVRQEDLEYGSEAESDDEAQRGKDDLWSEYDEQLRTGLQLEELKFAARGDALSNALIKQQAEYVLRHKEYLDPTIVEDAEVALAGLRE
jgi:hypothetical protein